VTGPYNAPPTPPPMPVQPAGRDNSTLFGVLGIIVSICCGGVAGGIVGIILGKLSRDQAVKFGKSTGLGTASIIVGALVTVAAIIYWIIYLARR
jgi:hypothetical protein